MGIINLQSIFIGVGFGVLPLISCKEKQRKSNLSVQLTLSMVHQKEIRRTACSFFSFCALDGEHPVCFSKQGALVFALTHFVQMIVRIAHIIANCLAFCLGKNLAKASAKHLCLNYSYRIYVQAI